MSLRLGDFAHLLSPLVCFALGNVSSVGSVRAKQSQYLPFSDHQHLKRDDVLQRLPHPCRLPKLHASLKDPEVPQDVCRALQTNAAHSLSGNNINKKTNMSVCEQCLICCLVCVSDPGEECATETRLRSDGSVGGGD